MFAKGPTPGAAPKQDALERLPSGTRCVRTTALGLTGYVVVLPDGRQRPEGLGKALDWALKGPNI